MVVRYFVDPACGRVRFCCSDASVSCLLSLPFPPFSNPSNQFKSPTAAADVATCFWILFVSSSQHSHFPGNKHRDNAFGRAAASVGKPSESMDTTDAPQMIEHIHKSLPFTPYDTRWIPCSARFVVMGMYPRAKGALHCVCLCVDLRG